MHDTLLKLYVRLQNLLEEDRGQDLIEYALLSSLIALAVISSSRSLANAVSRTFSDINASLA